MSTSSQIMTPKDDEAPVISGVGSDGTYECGETAVFSSPTASDNCSTAIISFEDTVAGGCAGINFTNVDSDGYCGNTCTASQTMNYR